MSKQRKAYGGSIYQCACGCGRRKNPRRRFASGCDGSKRQFQRRGSAKPNYDSTKSFTNQKRHDLVQYTGTEFIRINADARAAAKITSLGAAFRRGPKPKPSDKGDF
jgi:hypothetical protein